MQALHFAILPYRNYDGAINAEFVRLALIDEAGSVVNYDDINRRCWRNADDKTKDHTKFRIISRVYEKLENFSTWKPEFKLDDALYAEWYRWYFYIDDEDAYEYIRALDGKSQHSNHFQTSYGVILGWKYYKILRKRNFVASTSAKLAFMRGYLGAMQTNNPWEGEGLEALHCLGLDIEGGSTALMQ